MVRPLFGHKPLLLGPSVRSARSPACRRPRSVRCPAARPSRRSRPRRSRRSISSRRRPRRRSICRRRPCSTSSRTRLRDHHRDPGRSRRRRHAAQVRWLGLVQVRQHQGHQRGQGFRCCCPDGERSAAGRRHGSRARGGGGSASASGCGDAYRRGGDRGGSCSRRRSLCGACCCAGRGSGSAHDRGAGGEAREIREGTARSVDRHRQAEQADGRRPEGHRLHQARC